MKLHPTVLVVATAAVVTGLTGCGVVGGKADPTSSTVASGLGAPEQADADPTPAVEESDTTTTTTKKKPKHQSTPETSHTPKPQGPRVVSFKVVQQPKCEEGTAVFRAKAVPLIIKWKITGADSAALSVDDPTGTPGTYGPAELTGTQEFSFSCSGEVGSTETHTYAIYTVGGGPQKHKTLKVSAKVLDKDKGSLTAS